MLVVIYLNIDVLFVCVFQGYLLVGYATIFTMAPGNLWFFFVLLFLTNKQIHIVFSLVLDEDVNESLAFQYPELYWGKMFFVSV